MSKNYLASVDMDATFIRNDQSISDYTKEYIQKFEEEGNHFIINTGRPHQGALKFLKCLNINEPMIVNNGTAIVWYNQDLSEIVKYKTFHMNIDIVKQFNQEVKGLLKTELVTCIFDNYSYDFSTLPFWVIHDDKIVQRHEGDISQILAHDPIKMECYVKEECQKEFEAICQKEIYKNEFEFIYWGVYENGASYEFSKKGVNKGFAMQYLAKELSVPTKNIMAFGDQLNDVSMIVSANYGVAMINSRDDVKALAKYISTYDNNNDGVVNFIKEILHN